MSIAVCIPFRADPNEPTEVPESDGHPRKVIFEWVVARWQHLFPEYPIIVGDSLAGRPFNRAEARNNAAQQAFDQGAEVLILADADTIAHSLPIENALVGIFMAKERDQWVVPYRTYYQLTGPSTRAVMDRDPSRDVCMTADRLNARWQSDQSTAGLMVITRDAFETVGGLDQRFTGWAHEDVALSDALGTLVHPIVRTDGYLLHLRHPNHPTRQREKADGFVLYAPYAAATGDPEAMRKVIASR